MMLEPAMRTPTQKHRHPFGLNISGRAPSPPWFGLAFKTGEMMMASAFVINRRLTRMALAGANPNARDRREFQRMGQEKVEAATESLLAVSAQLAFAGPQLGAVSFQYWMKTVRALLATSTRPAMSVVGAQAALMGLTFGNSSSTAAKMASVSAKLAHHGLRPVHSRATANARRLLKR